MIDRIELKYKDGTSKLIEFPEEPPSFKLIKASRPLSQNIPPGLNEHDRIDMNQREIDGYNKRRNKFISENLDADCTVEVNYLPWGGYVIAT